MRVGLARQGFSLDVKVPTSTASIDAYVTRGFGPTPLAPDPAARQHLIPMSRGSEAITPK
jgi:hypothetical protein